MERKEISLLCFISLYWNFIKVLLLCLSLKREKSVQLQAMIIGLILSQRSVDEDKDEEEVL